MRLFLIISLVFLALFVHEIKNFKLKDKFGQQYMAVCLSISLLCLLPSINLWKFEKKLTEVTHELADFKYANVDCQNPIASIFDRSSIQTIGYANPGTGEVTIKTYWCKRIRSYLKNPEEADRHERYSIMLVVHEAMHIRGEMNESLTECQAIQRHIRGAKLLGVPHDIAVDHAKRYYLEEFSRHPYFSIACKPNSQWDEQLADSVWAAID